MVQHVVDTNGAKPVERSNMIQQMKIVQKQ
jgi:hypothetical protein